MIIEELDVHAVVSELPEKTLKMRMSSEDMSKMIPFFRDYLYSNKILAPIREYSTNARDEHIESGIPNTPIQVTLPSTFSPEFKVRDFGAGLTMTEIDNVYIQYLKSTKTNNNDVNGCLGIGCKSAFAYESCQAFTVTSWCQGRKIIYQFLADGNVIPMADVEMTPDEKTGIEILIPVALKDVNNFIDQSLNFYKYWDVRPTFLNVEQSMLDSYFKPMDEKPIFVDDIWEIRPSGGGYYSSGKSVIVMGFVPYPIDWDVARSNMDPLLRDKMYYLFNFLKANNVIIKLPIGSIEFTPNREALQYSEKTMTVISQKTEDIFNKILKIITDKISTASNIWEAKIIFNKIFDATVLGKDYAEKSEFGGNMKEILQIVGKNLKWNNIVLDNGVFDHQYFWDAYEGDVESSYSRRNHYHYVLETYVKNSGKQSGIEHKRCNRNKNNQIVASPNNVVVINDIEKYSPRVATAKYILNETHPTAERVYILNLKKDTVKTDFYKKFDFDSVPVIKLSDILAKVKAYAKANKVVSVSVGGGIITPKVYQPIVVPYLNVEDLRSKYTDSLNNVYWNNDSSSARSIMGVYVEFDRGSIRAFNKEWDKHYLNIFIQHIYDFCQVAGITLDKIHGVPTRTINSKWFNKAKDDGAWITIEDYVKSELAKLDKNIIQKVIEFANLDVHDINKHIGIIAAEKVLPLITDQNSDIFKYCKDVGIDIPKYFPIRNILRSFNLDDDYKDVVFDFKTKCTEIRDKYPLIFKLEFNSKLPYNKTNCTGYHITDDEAKYLAHYVNLVDQCNSKNQLTTATV